MQGEDGPRGSEQRGPRPAAFLWPWLHPPPKKEKKKNNEEEMKKLTVLQDLRQAVMSGRPDPRRNGTNVVVGLVS